MPDGSQGNGDHPLTEQESNFADALVQFFAAVESLSVARAQLAASGGNEYAAFISTIPEADRALATAQWPMLQMLLTSMPATLG